MSEFTASDQESYSYVVHDLYGCESGCCGHRAYLCENGRVVKSQWEFSHPYGVGKKEWAKAFCKNLWPKVEVRLDLCDVSND